MSLLSAEAAATTERAARRAAAARAGAATRRFTEEETTDIAVDKGRMIPSVCSYTCGDERRLCFA